MEGLWSRHRARKGRKKKQGFLMAKGLSGQNHPK
jgi:hypothetical protein